MRQVGRQIRRQPELRMLLGVAAAFAFVLSALKLPSVTGSCSHPTGTGLGAILFGPLAMAPSAPSSCSSRPCCWPMGPHHFGANLVSLAVVGPLVAAGVFRLARRAGASLALGVFLAASLADLMTYVTTSVQLAWAFPDPAGGFAASFAKFAGIFALTQIPWRSARAAHGGHLQAPGPVQSAGIAGFERPRPPRGPGMKGRTNLALLLAVVLLVVLPSGWWSSLTPAPTASPARFFPGPTTRPGTPSPP